MSEYQDIILGQILQDNDIWHKAGLTSSHFIDPWARHAFDHITKLIENGEPANIVTLARDIGEPSRVSGLTSLGTGNTDYYVMKVKEEHKRHALSVAVKYAAEQLEHEVDTDYVVGELEDKLVEIALTGQDDLRPFSAGLREFIDIVEDRYKNQGSLPGITTGFHNLDGITGGAEPGRLWYVGARPSKGKSALLLNLFTNAALDGKRVGLISLESSEREAYSRIFANRANITNENIRRGMLKPSHFRGMVDIAGEIQNWPAWICDNPEMTISQVKAVARKMVIAHKVDVLYVDYLQYIREDNDDTLRRDHIAAASRGLKAIARQLKVPVICAVQLRREVEDRKNQKPRLGDFAESSQVEKDADVAILLHDDGESLYFCVEKNRDGQTKDVRVRFDKEHARFEEESGWT